MALNMELDIRSTMILRTLISGISTCKQQSTKKKITYGQGQLLFLTFFCKETNKQEEVVSTTITKKEGEN